MELSPNLIGFVLAVCLALVHVFASRTQWVGRIPQRWWISIAGGVSIAYIFLDILPELSHAQSEVEHSSVPWLGYLEDHVYVLALAGLAAFYGLEKLALKSRSHQQNTQGADWTHPGVFWLRGTGREGDVPAVGKVLPPADRDPETGSGDAAARRLLAPYRLVCALQRHFGLSILASRGPWAGGLPAAVFCLSPAFFGE